MPYHSFIVIFPSEVSSRVVDSVEEFIGVAGKAVWGLALPLNDNMECLIYQSSFCFIVQPVSKSGFKTILSPIGP